MTTMNDEQIIEQFRQHETCHEGNCYCGGTVACDLKGEKWLRSILSRVRAEERERIARACDKNAFLLNEDVEDMVVYLADIGTITGVDVDKLTCIKPSDRL